MKNKKLTMFLTSLLVVSQLSLSVTVLAETNEERDSTEITTEEIINEKEVNKEEIKTSQIEELKQPKQGVSTTKISHRNNSKFDVEIPYARIPVGSLPSNLEPKDFIEDIYYGNAKLEKDDYNAEFIIPDDVEDEEDLFWYVEDKTQNVELKISLVDDEDEYTIENLPYSVIWGNTIISRDGYSTADTMTNSLSILTDKSGTPYLRPNMGNNKNGYNSRVRFTTGIDIYKETNEKSLIYLGPSSGATHSTNWLHWVQLLDGFKLEYGDVLKQSVFDQGGAPVEGKSTYTSRNNNGREVLVKETEGYPDAYYEITPNGYKLLQLNQLKMNQKILSFETGDSDEDIQKQAKSAIILPNHLENELDRFTYKLTDIDTSVSTDGKRVEGLMKVSEELETGGTFTISYPIDYEVRDGLEVKLNPISVPVGMPKESITPSDYVEEVCMNDKKLDSSEYTVNLISDINTHKVGATETEIKVEAVNGKKGTGKTQTNITWGHSLVSLANNKKDVDSSVSLLTNNNKPYLVANEGTGLSTANTLNSLTEMNVYRNNDTKEIYKVSNKNINQKPTELMNNWNQEFKNYDLSYGDVLTYTVFDAKETSKNENGKNTWVSRDGELVKDTEGHDVAYYELTSEGFNLLKLNQLKVNPKLIQVNVGTEEEEMNQKASETLIGSNTSNYEFKFAEFDTSKSGKQSGKVNVYETLATGGKFMTTYDVEYIVNPQVTEKYVTEKGEEIKSPVLTNFDFGTEYLVSPENFITVDGDVYIYQGWLEDNQTAGKDTPKKETPKAVKEATTFQYIYKKADSMIDMTIPTEMIFSTERESKNIVSKKQAFKNNSKDVSTEIIVTDFVSKKSDVKLLTEKDADPKKEVNEARFNLMKEDQIAIDSLNEKTKNQSITTLKSGETTDISLAGKYFGSQDKEKRVNYQMNFKFKAHVK